MKKILSLLVLSLFLVSCSDSNDDETVSYEELLKEMLEGMNMPRPVDSYNYPLLPGMDAWRKFTSTQEMIDACQVPYEILNKQSTQALIQAIWEYPFFVEIVFRANYYQKGFETVLSDNKAYKELVIRDNAGVSLLKRYLLVSYLIKGATVKPVSLELLLSQQVFLSQLNSEDKKQVVEIAFEKDRLRQISPNTANSVTRQATWLLIGRTMLEANYKPFIKEINNNQQLKHFLESSEIKVYTNEEYDAFFQLIISNGINFINQN